MPDDDSYDGEDESDLLSNSLDDDDRQVLHAFFHENNDKVGATLLSRRPQGFQYWHDGTEQLASDIGRRVWDRLTDIMCRLGNPAEHGVITPNVIGKFNQGAYPDFLIRNDIRTPIEETFWSTVFYETVRSKVLHHVWFSKNEVLLIRAVYIERVTHILLPCP